MSSMPFGGPWTDAKLTRRLVGWCKNALIWAEWRGPLTGCPMKGCQHYLSKRQMYVCETCGWATRERRDDCEHVSW